MRCSKKDLGWTRPKHAQLATALCLSCVMSYAAISCCAGKSRKEKKSTSQSQQRLLSDSSACFYPTAYSVPTLQRKEVRSKGCKHEYIAKTLNRNAVAKHTH